MHHRRWPRLSTAWRHSKRPSFTGSRSQRHNALLGELTALKLARNLSFVHDNEAVTHVDQLRQIGGNHHDGTPLARQRTDDFKEFRLGIDIDAPRGFIE